jgi:hypothetical protein
VYTQVNSTPAISPIVDSVDDEALQQRRGLREGDAAHPPIAGVLVRIEFDQQRHYYGIAV